MSAKIVAVSGNFGEFCSTISIETNHDNNTPMAGKSTLHLPFNQVLSANEHIALLQLNKFLDDFIDSWNKFVIKRALI